MQSCPFFFRFFSSLALVRPCSDFLLANVNDSLVAIVRGKDLLAAPFFLPRSSSLT